MHQKLKYYLFLFTFLLASLNCYALTATENKNIIKSIYNEEFYDFASKTYNPDKKFGTYYVAEHNNVEIFLNEMVKNIESKALKEGIKIKVSPKKKDKNQALLKSTTDLFADKFNPLAEEIMSNTPESFAKLLLWLGYSVAYTRFNRIDLNKDYFEKIYIVGTALNINAGRSLKFKVPEDFVQWKLIYVKQPYAAQDKHLKSAQAAAYNFDFQQADIEYNLGKSAPNSDKVLKEITEQKNIIIRTRRSIAQTAANTAYWKKRDRERKKSKSHSSLPILLKALETAAETQRIISQNKLTTTIAMQEANRIGTPNPASMVPDTEYQKRLSALKAMNAAYIERQALYRIKGNLMNLYHEEKKGLVFRQTIDKEISNAEQNYNSKKSAFDSLTADQTNRDQVADYVQRNPQAAAAVNQGIKGTEIDKRFEELKNKYKYFYSQNENLYK